MAWLRAGRGGMFLLALLVGVGYPRTGSAWAPPFGVIFLIFRTDGGDCSTDGRLAGGYGAIAPVHDPR
jgi:hypothetical protein